MLGLRAGGKTPFKIDNAARNNLLRQGRNSRPNAAHIAGKLGLNASQMNGPHDVFYDDYALRPLASVQTFIDENSHLPDVPSEAEITAHGVGTTAMQMVQLKKIEGLTLYTLSQEDRIADLTARLTQSKAQMAK